jgi:hypothetical protein
MEVGVIFCSGKNLSDGFMMLFISGSIFGLVRNFDIKGNQSITFFGFLKRLFLRLIHFGC